MKKIAIAALVALTSVAVVTEAKAQTRNNSNANSSSYSESNSRSNARSSGNVTSFHDRRQAPGVAAPGISAGGQSCAAGGSMGVSAPGFGITFGAMTEKNDCNKRENAGMANALFGRRAAQQVACKIEDLRDLPECQRFNNARGGVMVNNRRAARQQVASAERKGPPTMAEWMASRR